MGKGKPHPRVLSRVTQILGHRFPARHHNLGLCSSLVELSLFNSSWFGICLFHRCRREEIAIPRSEEDLCGPSIGSCCTLGLVGVQQEACERWKERLPGEVSQAGNPEALLYPLVLMRQWS